MVSVRTTGVAAGVGATVGEVSVRTTWDCAGAEAAATGAGYASTVAG